MEIVEIEEGKSHPEYKCKRQIGSAMVIDDVEEDIYVLEKMIERHYFSKKLIKCSNSIEALSYLQANADNPEQLPDIIFLDLAMPELNGFEFLDHFASLSPLVRSKCKLYIYSSSKADEEYYLDGKHPLVAGFVPKPINIILLLGVNSDYHQHLSSD
jgi:CheY-like chemotaxis protein